MPTSAKRMPPSRIQSVGTEAASNSRPNTVPGAANKARPAVVAYKPVKMAAFAGGDLLGHKGILNSMHGNNTINPG